MKEYSPGASMIDDFAYGCDSCETWGAPCLVWNDLPDGRDHFVLCFKCLDDLHKEYLTKVYKNDERIIVRRKIISEDLRNYIFKEFGYKCFYCGARDNLQVDHIVPFIKGGTTDKSNLQLLCKSCNLTKGSKVGDKLERVQKTTGRG